MIMTNLISLLMFSYYLVANQVQGELVCPRIKRGIAGENLSIECQSSIPLLYITMAKSYDGGKRTTIVTVNETNGLIFYNDSNGMEYRTRVEVEADMPRGIVNITLRNLVPSDSGPYELLYKTKKDILDYKLSLLVKVLVPPTISCQNFTLVEGHKGFLYCNVSGSQPMTITWSKGNSTWNGNNILMPVIKRIDEGWYKVVANNSYILDVQWIYNKVLYKPESPNIALQTNKSVFYKEDEIRIYCRAAANPPADYLLYCNNKLVPNNSYDENQGVFSVQLTGTGMNTFLCVPSNEIGTGQNRSLSIFVQDNFKEPANSGNNSLLSIVIISVVLAVLLVFGLLIRFFR